MRRALSSDACLLHWGIIGAGVAAVGLGLASLGVFAGASSSRSRRR